MKLKKLRKSMLLMLMLFVFVMIAFVLTSFNQMGTPDVCPELWLLYPKADQTGLGTKVRFQWHGIPWNPGKSFLKEQERDRENWEIDYYVLLYGKASDWESETNIIRIETTETSAESYNLFFNTEYYWMVIAFQELDKVVWTQVGPRSFTTMKEPGEMVTIPAGQFTMGDHFHPEWEGGETAPWYLIDQPAHVVALSQSFQIGKYEVTNQEYVAFLNNMKVPFYEEDPAYPTEGKGWLNGKPVIKTHFEDPSTGIYYDIDLNEWVVKTSWTNTNVVPNVTVPLNYAAMPVVNVSWYGATFYCDWLSQMMGHEEAYGLSTEIPQTNSRDNVSYRLPTEAEWEYCVRDMGGDTLYSGTSIFPANYAFFAWNSDYSDGTGQRVHEIGQKLPNMLGLYDMTGNVFEMCSDWYEIYCAQYGEEGCPPLITDPAGPEQPDPAIYTQKVMRGGSWATDDGDDGQTYLSNVRRHSIFHEGMENDVGFRVARTLSAE